MNITLLITGIISCLLGWGLIFIDSIKLGAPMLIIPGGLLLGIALCKKCESVVQEKKPEDPEKKSK